MAEDRSDRLTLRIPGVRVSERDLDRRQWQAIEVKEIQTFRLGATRADTPPESITTAPDDVVEIELEDGTRLWTSRERLCDEILSPVGQREVGKDFAIPITLPLRSPSRGLIGAAIIKTLRFFKLDVPKRAARKLATLWEDHTLARGPGLYRCATSERFESTSVHASDVPTDRPILLFLHGTVSSTRGSFGGLWTRERQANREQLFAPYQNQVFAFEHRTLTESPIQNAVALAAQLPTAARLHLVSHSRGGLVGELLCHARMTDKRDPFDADARQGFRDRDPQKQRGDLEQLNALLKAKRFQVERFARVACPARGTSLASERFDLYLSVLFNLLQKVPALSVGPGGVAYDILTELIMATAKERADPSLLPGIEAMIPSSPLIALLNQPGRVVEGALRVIAGDIEGENLTSLLGALLTDPLYLGDHDLVVDTASMYGGVERRDGAAFSFHQGAEVSHFRYFQNTDSASRLVRALTCREGQEDGFERYSVRQADVGLLPSRRDDGRPRPVVFLLPGIMGSHLTVNGERVWLDLSQLGQGGLSRLTIEAQNVTPEAPVEMAYGDLVKFLSPTHDVVPFPYDWRLSLATEAQRLAAAITDKLDQVERHNQPVGILAHSMGGLLARAMIADPQGSRAWRRMCKHPDARLIMLGTPNGGSYIVPLALTGRETIIKQLALLNLLHLNLAHHETALIDIIRRYPGLIEMLPESDEQYDFFSPEAWNSLHKVDRPWHAWEKPEAEALERARAVRSTLSQSPSEPERMCYVAGCAPATPAGFYVEKDRQGRDRLRVRPSPQGDGRVLWETGRLPRVKTWYMQAVHGDLAAHEPAFPALLDLLRNGETNKLSTTPPETRGAQDLREFPEEKTPLYPDTDDLTRAALGSRRKISKRKTPHRTRVTIVHGNLAYAAHAVMVGHYQGDTIVSAEAQLDRTLGGRLRDHQSLGLYPGAQDTAEVFLSPESKPQGAIVTGLGPVGELSPGRLIQAASRGVRAYAVALMGNAPSRDAASQSRRSAKISTVLIGTGAGGISLQDSVLSILRGVAHAREHLETTGYAERVNLDEIEFLELYEDRAIQAAHALARVKSDVDLTQRFEIDRELHVQSRRGGRRRASFFEDLSWWHRLQIIEERDERRLSTKRLQFNLLTDRARTEEYLRPTQRALVDQFIDGATQTTATDEEIAVTLFEMLVPNRLKEYAPDRRDIVLLLDEHTARYPWELLRERRASDGATREPLAIQAGMVRQLQSLEFRENALTAQGRLALVVGDPPSQFVRLHGAEKEARNVVGLLKGASYEVTSVIRQEENEELATDILRVLYARDYRVVHLAGHGVYEYLLNAQAAQVSDGVLQVGEAITGMVIGHDKFLTPAEFQQMRVVPDLVFINCCHLGRTEDAGASPPNNPPQLAANVATQLIRMGVRAVVAAGWAVDDAAAQTFAEQFYHDILGNVSFGQAVKNARRAVFAAHPGVNTWGAYQCYGDPAFTLSAGAAVQGSDGRALHFAAPAEMIAALENIAEDATTIPDSALAELKKHLKTVTDHIPAEWLGNATLRAALGRAHGELDLFAEAVSHYQEALRAERAAFPVSAVEQLCNLQTRWAVQVAAAPNATTAKRKEATDNIGRAKKRLDNLIDTIGATAERLSLKGSIAKREVVIARTLNDKRRALREMSKHYKEAHELGLKKEQGVDPYPLLNWMTAEILLGVLDKGGLSERELYTRLQEVEAVAADRDLRDPKFWNAVALVDSKLLYHLARGDLGDHTKELTDRYLTAKQRDASPREFRSVLEQLDFLAGIIAVSKNNRKKSRLSEALKKIWQGLTS